MRFFVLSPLADRGPSGVLTPAMVHVSCNQHTYAHIMFAKRSSYTHQTQTKPWPISCFYVNVYVCTWPGCRLRRVVDTLTL